MQSSGGPYGIIEPSIEITLDFGPYLVPVWGWNGSIAMLEGSWELQATYIIAGLVTRVIVCLNGRIWLLRSYAQS